MFTDYVLNGEPHGEVATEVSRIGFDDGMLRPWRDSRGRVCVTLNTGRTEQRKNGAGHWVTNSDGTLKNFPIYKNFTVAGLQSRGVYVPPFVNATTMTKDAWIRIDRIVITVARERLRAYAALRGIATLGGFDGMATPILEWETANDVGEAVVDMDAMSEGRNFTQQFKLEGTPLPITHSDFWLSQRFIASSQNRGMPADTSRAEGAARRVGESIEKTTVGTQTGLTYGLSTDYGSTAAVYGFTNHPDRITSTSATTPTGSNGTAVLTNWLAMRQALYDAKFYGDFDVFVSDGWDAFLDDEFKTNSDRSLRERLLMIDGLRSITRLDYLTTDYQVVWVERQPRTARAINGMPIRTVQWPSQGGMRQNFKVMGIQVPNLRSDYNQNMGLLHAS